MSKKTVSASELSAKLGNSKMASLVARMFGKERFSLSEAGTVEISDEEAQRIAATYGEGFLEKLRGVNFSEASEQEADNLFEEAVRFRASEMTANKDAVIAQLRSDIEELSRQPEPSPAPRPAGSGSGRQFTAFQVDMSARHNRIAAEALESANPMAMTVRADDQSIDVGDLNTEFGKVMPPRVRLDIFNRNIYLGLPDAALFTREQSNTDYKATASLMTEVSQAFTAAWTPKGRAKFTPITIPYRRHKVNVNIKPAEVIKSWLTYLYEQGKTPAEQPITRYIAETLILPKVQDDITRVMLGKGKYSEPSSSVKDGDAGTDAAASMDGIETILVDDKAAETRKFNHYVASKDPFTLKGQELLDYVGGFAQAVSKYFVNKPLIYCSEEFLQHYQQQDFAVNGKYTGQSTGNSIRFSAFTFQPMKCMYGSPILFCTPKVNLTMLVDYVKASNCINDFQKFNYDIHVFGEYSLSVGFKIAEAVYAAVPNDYSPANTVIGNSPADTEDSNWLTGTAADMLSEKSEDEETI